MSNESACLSQAKNWYNKPTDSNSDLTQVKEFLVSLPNLAV